MIQPVRALTLAALAATALLAAGCGNKEDVVLEGKTEGVYLDIGELKYQVQISRQLNPYDGEDREYLTAVSPLERDLAPDETWFGVFMRVENDTPERHAVVTDFEVRDTRGEVFKPIPLGEVNTYAYRPPAMLNPKGTIGEVYPRLNSSAGFGPTRGALLLFKFKKSTLALRPLKLYVKPKQGEEGVVDLDV